MTYCNFVYIFRDLSIEHSPLLDRTFLCNFLNIFGNLSVSYFLT